MSGELISTCVEELNRKFVNATEFLDPVIRKKAHATRSLYRNMINRGVFPLGEGLTQKTHIFHPGLGDQAGMTKWTQIAVGRAPGTNGESDPGYDPCKYSAYMLSYGFQTKDFLGYHTERRTPDICLKDIRFTWQFKQQIALIFGYLADVTLSIWENYGREGYINFANKYILTNDPYSQTFTYAPFTSTDITIPRDIDVSMLTLPHLDYWHQLLSLQAPIAALSNDSGMPIFGLVIHPKDFDDMIRRDSNLRDDFRWGNPEVLIEKYGKVKAFKGFSFINDIQAPRFKVKSIAATTITLERVDPFETEATTIGEKVKANPDYVQAEYAIGVIFLKDVYEILVPPAGPSSPGGGTEFGDQPSLNGEFKWLNIQDKCENLLREKGFYFARYEGFLKPLDYSEDAVVFLYKRCVDTPLKLCATVGEAGAKAITGAEAIDPDGDNSYTQVKVTLAAKLPCAAPAEVTVTFKDATTAVAVLSEDGEAPIYTLTFATAAAWLAAGNGLIGGTVTCI